MRGNKRVSRRGSWSSNATIDERTAAAIFTAVCAGGESMSSIAKRFNTTQAIVSLIAQGRRWKHVTELMKPMALTRNERGNLKGSKHHKAILAESDVIQIKVLLREQYTLESIGKVYGVGKGTIWQISCGRQWTHVKIANHKPEKRMRSRAKAKT